MATDGWMAPTGASPTGASTSTAAPVATAPANDGWNPPTGNANNPPQLIPGINKPPDLSQADQAKQFGKDVVIGAGKGALQTVTGLGELAREHIPTADIAIPQSVVEKGKQLSTPKGFGENLGVGLENMGEFAAGDEALMSMGKFAKIAHYAPELIQLMEDYPKASKIILGTMRGGTVGGAQGAVKGTIGPEGTKKGAEEGAIGGAVGGAIAGTGEALFPRVARSLGVGGQDYESAMAKAGRPSIPERNWKQSLEISKPLILDHIDPKDINSIDDFVGGVKNIKEGIWNTVKKQIKDVGKGVFSAHDVAVELNNSVSPEFEDLFPEEAAEIRKFATKFDKNMTIDQAHNYIELMNAKLKNYYKLSPETRAALGKTDGGISALETASDNLREKMFDEIEARDQKSPRELRKQYGALSDIERTFTKRIPVADRQSPMNMAQILSLAGGSVEAANALIAGHPLQAAAGMVPLAVTTAAKLRNAPESLIRQGLRAGAREGTESVASNLGKKVVAGAAANAHQWVRMQHPESGNIFEVHPEDAGTAEERGLIRIPVEEGH